MRRRTDFDFYYVQTMWFNLDHSWIGSDLGCLWVVDLVGCGSCHLLQYLNAKKSPSLRVLNWYWAELLVQADLENFATITKIATLPVILLIVMSKDGVTIIHSDSIGEGKDGDTFIHSDSIGEGKDGDTFIHSNSTGEDLQM
jgi:hypothetical protein